MKSAHLFRILSLFVVLALGISAAAVAEAPGFDLTPLLDAGMQIEAVHVGIPGCRETYHFLWVSDLHIAISDDEVAEEYREMVRGRQYGWAVTPEGQPAGEFWNETLAGAIDAAHADAVFFGADMLDLCTASTVDCLKRGLDKITTPYMYIRADHDYGTHWTVDPDAERNRQRQLSICPYDATCCMEFEPFVVLGINDSTVQLTEEGLAQVRDVFAKGKPVIVVTHVPYHSETDASLEEASRAAWQDRNLTWGSDASYVPNETTSEYLALVYADQSQVKAVLAGHLHLSWDGYITDQIHQHVFSPAYSKYIGLITVDGNME